MKTFDASQIQRIDQIGAAGELEERTKVRHHPKQRRHGPPADYAEVCVKPRICGDGLRSWGLLVDFSA